MLHRHRRQAPSDVPPDTIPERYPVSLGTQRSASDERTPCYDQAMTSQRDRVKEIIETPARLACSDRSGKLRVTAGLRLGRSRICGPWELLEESVALLSHWARAANSASEPKLVVTEANSASSSSVRETLSPFSGRYGRAEAYVTGWPQKHPSRGVGLGDRRWAYGSTTVMDCVALLLVKSRSG